MLCLAVASAASAQVHPIQLLEPWEPHPHWARTYDEPIFINKSHTKQGDQGVGIFYWDSYGRVKLDREDQRPPFVIGYKILTIDINSDAAALPGGLTDIALVGAGGLGQLGEDWQLYLIGGLGTANDNHFSNGDAIYGLATLHATQTIDPTRKLHIGLGYDGNRVIFPDVPLPYIMYQQQFDETFALAVGAPVNVLTWRPVHGLAIQLRYVVPTNLGASVTYHFTEDLSVYAEYKSSTDAFYVHNRDNRRLFYEMDRVATGVRWLSKWVDLTVAVGYAFEQEFNLGWDLRDTDSVADLSDEIFLSFKIQGTF